MHLEGSASHSNAATSQQFNVWATSDAHIIREAMGEGYDPRRVPRDSMAAAIAQAEGADGFDYDVGFHLGDHLDYDFETAENFSKFVEQLEKSGKGRHAWYHIGGNNDENSVLNDGVAIDNEYYRKIIDPVGEFTDTSGINNQRRPYPVTGTYERYHIDVGNLRFLFLSDRNDLPAPYGRGEGGFFVDGAITLESFQWLVGQVMTFPERLLVVCCHHPLKDTTLATEIDDSWRGQYMTPYKPQKAELPEQRMQGVLHQIYPVSEFDTPLFHHLLDQNQGAVDLWLSGHIHHRVEETFRGRGKYAKAYGGHHLNIGNICRYRHFANIISAQSNLFNWEKGSDRVRSRVFVHDHAELAPGFYGPEERWLELKTAWTPEPLKEPNIEAPSENVAMVEFEGPKSHIVRLKWEGDCTGILVVCHAVDDTPFHPVDGTVYHAGQEVPGGRIIFCGSSKTASPSPVSRDEAERCRAFAYQAGGGKIRYFPGEGSRVGPAESA